MMKIIIPCFILSLTITGCQLKANPPVVGNFYPETNERMVSKENTTYYIDPVSGSDKNGGTKKEAPWKTFRRVNQLQLTKGNRIEILSPGTFRESLFIIGQGTQEFPITIQLAPGKYDFYPKEAVKRKFHISNTNDAPDSLKAIVFYFLDCKNLHIKGHGAEIVLRGKAIETALTHCEDVSIEGISFDYKRPTVSEMRVMHVNDRFADVRIHKDSRHEIVDSQLAWIGEGWEDKAQNLWQVFDPENQEVSRKDLSVGEMRFSKLAHNQVRIYFDKNPGFIEGLIYQNRNTFRDYAALFVQKSKNISLKNVHIYFMHGMGIVSQYCENITIDSLIVRPRENSGRTCAAWADILHFSGCKGKVEISNSYLSAANDDAVNVHGTHLRIVESVSKRKVKVRFMHSQTYGLDAFYVGDSIEFISAKSLLPFSKNKISKVRKLNDKEIELTLEQNVPNSIRTNDVIENSSWTTDVTIQNTKIARIPTRGVLVTTRGKVIIENNKFIKTHMSGILIADDANFWFESGYVRDVTIRNNQFIDCGSPVINIHPENSKIVDGHPVHRNIRIVNNQFVLGENVIISAKSTGNIEFSNNTIEVDSSLHVKDLIHLKSCLNVEIKDNQINPIVVGKGYEKEAK